MAHNSAHYSLVNVGLGFMQCYDGVMMVRVKHPFVCLSAGRLAWPPEEQIELL